MSLDTDTGLYERALHLGLHADWH